MRSITIRPDWVSRPLFIEAGEVTIDATGYYCDETGVLYGVEINGNVWPVKAVQDWLQPICANHVGNWARDLTDEEIRENRK